MPFRYKVLNRLLRERTSTEDNGADVVPSLVPLKRGDIFLYSGRWWRVGNVGVNCDETTYSSPEPLCMEVEPE